MAFSYDHCADDKLKYLTKIFEASLDSIENVKNIASDILLAIDLSQSLSTDCRVTMLLT